MPYNYSQFILLHDIEDVYLVDLQKTSMYLQPLNNNIEFKISKNDSLLDHIAKKQTIDSLKEYTPFNDFLENCIGHYFKQFSL